MRVLLLTIALLLLMGCTNFTTKTDLAADAEGRARDYTLGQGLNVIEFDDLICNEAVGLCGPTGLRIIGGKEQDSITVKMYNSEGKLVFDYSASQVRAFEGQQFRAETTQILEEHNVDAVKSLLDAITEVARTASGIP